MLELNYALNLIVKGIEGTASSLGFTVEYPEGVRPPEAPVFTEGKKSVVMFRGEKGRFRFEYENGKIGLFCATASESDTPDNDMTRASLSLLDLDEYDERDLKYIFDEFSETITNTFSTKKELNSGKKLPTPVSKAKAKSGVLAYDSNTLGSRFTTNICPELRDEYKKNIEEYGEFLAEDFFVNHGNKKVLEIIRENDKIKMRKLFTLLNEIYEDGTNDTQSLVAVTVLGSISEDLSLLENARPYFSDTMAEPVEEVIKYLASNRSKSARMRLENPPVYKPKKKKKQGAFASMLGMQ